MSKLKVLFADDEADFREIISSRIRSWGYDLITASDGKESLDAVKSQAPDIIILDYMMPDMTGVEVLKEIRKAGLKTPVIMFTAYPDDKMMEETEKLGVSAFIPKLSKYVDTQVALKSALSMIEKSVTKE